MARPSEKKRSEVSLRSKVRGFDGIEWMNIPSIVCTVFFFEAEGFGLPCTAWAGSGLLVKSRLIRIRADEGARERTRSFEIELVLAATGRDIQIKCVDWHAIIYYVMRKQARWGNADAGSYLIAYVKHD
jgi:hypothetical protein